ncbi:hypothetical protein L195_g000324 [Trifolium pratense]|uniref:Uncharacterized protein n=1 Tax=Trifolium pratense TaxID=57577 RepID=A0A2K3NLJ8_TRIPR|nr:hypothetical protein L195_g000324 [Trifolium pratense]
MLLKHGCMYAFEDETLKRKDAQSARYAHLIGVAVWTQVSAKIFHLQPSGKHHMKLQFLRDPDHSCCSSPSLPIY